MKHTVTLFKLVSDTSVGYQKDVSFVLDRIRSGKSKDLISKIREGKKEFKKKLPGVCFNGSFKYRNEAGLIEHSGLIILDFDKIPKDDFQAWIDTLQSCEFVFSSWVSPSGDGIKALIKIPKEPENHKLYYEAIKSFFDCEYLDDSGKDLPRFCFESYDPDIYINNDSTTWFEKAVEEIEDVGCYDPVIPVTSENRIVDNLLKWWKKKYGATKGNRNNNLYKLAIAFNDFGVNQQEGSRVLEGFAEKDFNITEIQTLVKSAYKNQSAFNSKFFEDSEMVRIVEKQIRSGKKSSDIIRKFPNIDENKLLESIDCIKEDLGIKDFWYYTDNGTIKLSPHKFKFWLQQNNFFKYYPTDNSTYTFIHQYQNLLEETNDKRIKDFVLESLLKNTDVGYQPYDFMTNNTKFFSTEYLSFLETTEVNIKEDTATESYIYFKNCVAKVTKDNIEQIDYSDIDGFVWKRQIIDADFNKVDHHKSVFRKFLWLISGEDVERYNSLKSVIGYLLHSYKTSSNNKAIIFNDETISENPNGGSGKGLFWNALKEMKRVASIDGKTFDFTKSFPYQTVSTDTQLLVFDDVKKNFSFESLFSLITEGITLEYKGQDAIKLPVQQSPKILITTNYTVGGIGGSFERRKFEVELSSYFNNNHTPLDEFGHLLFDDWNSKEWDKFYSFMLNCSQYYLEHGLKEYDSKNLHVRKFIKETSFDFYEWANDGNIPVNVRFDKKELYEAFKEEYNDFKKWLSQKRFTSWVTIYGKKEGHNLVSGKTNGQRWMKFENSKSPTPPAQEKDELPF